MKKLVKCILSIFLLLGTAITIQAYQYPFFNHTSEPIAIAIQFIGGNEPLYKKLIRSQTSEIFEEGKFGIPSIKSSFCIQHIYYIKNPNKDDKKNNYENAFWRKIPILWTAQSVYRDIMHQLNAQKEAVIKKIAPIDNNTTQVLSEVIKSIKPTKPQTLCTNRRFEIIEDEQKKLYLIATFKD